MAYDEYLQERIEIILNEKKVSFIAKKMMGGLCYMIDDKMCFGVVKNDFMANVGESASYSLNDLEGVRLSDAIEQPIKGCLYIATAGLEYDSDLKYWIKKSLEFNVPKSKKK